MPSLFRRPPQVATDEGHSSGALCDVVDAGKSQRAQRQSAGWRPQVADDPRERRLLTAVNGPQHSSYYDHFARRPDPAAVDGRYLADQSAARPDGLAADRPFATGHTATATPPPTATATTVRPSATADRRAHAPIIGRSTIIHSNLISATAGQWDRPPGAVAVRSHLQPSFASDERQRSERRLRATHRRQVGTQSRERRKWCSGRLTLSLTFSLSLFV